MHLNADIAVVIPCYNHANVLRRTIEALQKQTLLPREIVLVDDGSVDNPRHIFVSALPPLSSRTQRSGDPGSVPTGIPDHVRDDRGCAWSFVRFETNRGAPAARNEGARRTTAPLLLFLDADAELVPDALETMRKALEDHPDAAFAYSDFFWGHRRFRARPFDVAALQRSNYIHTSSLLRRDAFSGFDETLTKFQDWDLWLTMTEQGKKGVWIDRALYRIEPREHGLSRWLPRFAYQIPWERLGFIPKDIRRYRDAETIIRRKHRLA
jgi:glycosyltransferase involved in cell wall biosynthesis